MNIALIGYGKMGKAIEKIALESGHSIGTVIRSEDQLPQLLANNIALVIEFTQPKSAFQNIHYCIENGIPIISGTTGWIDDLAEIESICKKMGGTFLHASNFSIGVNLFFEFNRWLAYKMSSMDFDPLIEEVHHTEKKDNPSGTAITLAEGIISSQPTSFDGWTNVESTDQKKLRIISHRQSNIPGTHTVTYSSPLESIEINHVAHDRSVFAQGVIKVAEWIYTKKGVFTMSDFINDN